MQKVIFDSSFLMAVAEHPTTWFEDIVDYMGRFQPVLLDCVKKELEIIASDEGKRAAMARVALEMSVLFSPAACGAASVDSEIQSSALGAGATVATADGELLRSLRAAGVKVLTLRKGRVAPG